MNARDFDVAMVNIDAILEEELAEFDEMYYGERRDDYGLRRGRSGRELPEQETPEGLQRPIEGQNQQAQEPGGPTPETGSGPAQQGPPPRYGPPR